MPSPPRTTPPQNDAEVRSAAVSSKHPTASDSIIVEVRSPQAHPPPQVQRDWHPAPERSAAPRTAIVPASATGLRSGGGGAIRRFAQRAAQADINTSVTLSRLGKIAGSLTALTAQSTIGIGVTSTNRKNNQALTAIGIATVWAKWGHRTLLVNADPGRNQLTKALQQTTPSLSELIQALEAGKKLALPQALTATLHDLEALSGLGAFSLAQIGETGILQQLDYALRTRYDRIVWSLPPLNRQDWSPILIRPVVDSLIISAKRGRTDLRLVEKLAQEMSYTDWPPLQVTWHE